MILNDSKSLFSECSLFETIKGDIKLKMADSRPLDPISLLLLSPKWQFDTYGVSSVIRSLANNLWLIDPEGKRIQMTCAVLQEDGKINHKDVEDATKHNVMLRGVKLRRGR